MSVCCTSLVVREINCSGDKPFDASQLNCNWMVIGDGVIYESNSVPSVPQSSVAASIVSSRMSSTPTIVASMSASVAVPPSPSSIPSSVSTAAISAFHEVYTGLCTIPNPINANAILIVDNGEGANNPCAQLCLATTGCVVFYTAMVAGATAGNLARGPEYECFLYIFLR
jgi:hypothetical protein